MKTVTIKELYQLAVERNATDYIIVSTEWGNISKEEIEWDDEDKYISI